MDTALPRHLVFEELVDHTVAGRLHLGPEGVGRDYEPEMGLLGRAPDHGLVMSVLMRIIEDLETRRLELV